MRIRLRAVRERALLTQEELAQRAGLTKATVNRLETGLTEPRISTIRKLAKALAVDASDLIVAGDASE